jgi:hypothetical protein
MVLIMAEIATSKRLPRLVNFEINCPRSEGKLIEFGNLPTLYAIQRAGP